MNFHPPQNLQRSLPVLLPPSLTAVYTAISELLCLGRETDALLASQLLVLLVPSSRRLVLLRLLQFMNIAGKLYCWNTRIKRTHGAV